jgi:hypothetical protein
MPRKEFDAFTRLDASDVNTYLMDQAVQSFAGTAARGSAIPSPVTGMTTYLEDTKDLRVYDGSAYRSPFGLTQLVNQDITAQTTFNVDNVFTSEFENYRVIINLTANSASTNAAFNLRFRKDESTISAAEYNFAIFYQNANGTDSGVFQRGTTATEFNLLNYGRTGRSSYATIDILGPQIASQQTGITWLSFCSYSLTAAAILYGGGNFFTADNFDGLHLFSGSGNMTGNIKIYGYRN